MGTFTDHLHLPVTCVDDSEKMLAKLKGLTDPEAKRKAIGGHFIEVGCPLPPRLCHPAAVLRVEAQRPCSAAGVAPGVSFLVCSTCLAAWHLQPPPPPQVFDNYAKKLEKELGIKPKFLVQVRGEGFCYTCIQSKHVCMPYCKLERLTVFLQIQIKLLTPLSAPPLHTRTGHAVPGRD